MRISSATFYAASLTGIRDQQSAIARLNQQIGSGQRLLAAKDDPVAMGRVLALSESIASRVQFQSNQQKAELALKQEHTLLDGLYSALSSVRQALVDTSAGHDQSLRDQAAATLAGLYAHIKSLLNYRDPGGDYIFAGYETATQPYSHVPAYDPALPGGPADSPDSAYGGDAGVRRIEVEQGRFVQINDNLNGFMQAGGGADMLELIDQAAIDLHDAVTPAATLQGRLDAAYADLGTVIDGVRNLTAAVAGRLMEVDDAGKSTEQFLLQERNALGSLTELDQAAAIVELQQRQVSLQAAESAFSLTAKLSLFNYLS